MAKAPKKKRKTKAGGNVEIGPTFKRKLPCEIDEDAAGRKKSEVIQLLTEVNIQKEKQRPMQEKVKELKLRIESLRNDVDTMTEEREVDCHEELDFAHRKVAVVREDSDEVVDERTMTDEERQTDNEIDDLPANASKAAPEGGDGGDGPN